MLPLVCNQVTLKLCTKLIRQTNSGYAVTECNHVTRQNY